MKKYYKIKDIDEIFVSDDETNELTKAFSIASDPDVNLKDVDIRLFYGGENLNCYGIVNNDCILNYGGKDYQLLKKQLLFFTCLYSYGSNRQENMFCVFNDGLYDELFKSDMNRYNANKPKIISNF